MSGRLTGKRAAADRVLRYYVLYDIVFLTIHVLVTIQGFYSDSAVRRL